MPTPIVTGPIAASPFLSALPPIHQFIADHVPASVAETISQFGFHPDSMTVAGSAACAYGIARTTIGHYASNWMFCDYEDTRLKAAKDVVESHATTGRFISSMAKILTVTGLGVAAALVPETGISSEICGTAFLYGAGMYAIDFGASALGVFVDMLTTQKKLSATERFNNQLEYGRNGRGKCGGSWQLEDFLERHSVTVETQSKVLQEGVSLRQALRKAMDYPSKDLALFMDKVLMRAVNPELSEAYRINLLGLISVYLKECGAGVCDSVGSQKILCDERLLNLLVTGPNKIKTAAHGVYAVAQNASIEFASSKIVGAKLAAFYLANRTNEMGLASYLVQLPVVAVALLDSPTPLSREEFLTRVDNAVKDGAKDFVNLGQGISKAITGKHQRAYVKYVDQTYQELGATSPEAAGDKELKNITFLRQLFQAFNIKGTEKPMSPVAALKVTLPFIVSANAAVRREVIQFQDAEAHQLNTAEKRQWHESLVTVLKSSDQRGLLRQPAPIKIEVLQFMARTAPIFKDINSRADYDYTVGYLFDPDSEVRVATAKTHFDLIKANSGDQTEETAYLDVIIARVLKVTKRGEPSQNEKLRFERVMEAVSTVFPALSDEGKKRVVRVLNTIEWGFVSEQYDALILELKPGEYNRSIFDPVGRVQYVRDAFKAFLAADNSEVKEEVLSAPEGVVIPEAEDTPGENITKSLLDLSPADIFAYVQEKAHDAVETLKAHPVKTVAAASAGALIGTGISALVLWRALKYARTESGREKIVKYAPNGKELLEFIDEHLPASGTPASWIREGIWHLPHGAKILGAVATYFPPLANWAMPPDLMQAATQILARVTPTAEEIRAAVDKSFAENPIVPPVQAKSDADGDGSGGNGDASQPEIVSTDGAATAAVAEETTTKGNQS